MSKKICKETMAGRKEIQKKSPKFECELCCVLSPTEKHLCKPKKLKGI